MTKRLEWRIAEKHTNGLPALLLIDPLAQDNESAVCVCSFHSRDVTSMHAAAEQARAATKAYRAEGWIIVDKNLTLKNMLAV